MDYDTIIIGAGPGGLTAGAKLAGSGKKVLVLEKHLKPGGCATIFKRKDFIFEVGLHELDGFNETGFKSKNKKKEVQNILIEQLEKQLPGIKKIIEYTELSTPKTIKRYTLNSQGSPYGYAQTLDQTAKKRLKNRSIIPGLYYASAWSSPGGGFSGAIYSGYICALTVMKDMKKL